MVCMELTLAGHKAVITGGSRGLGKAIAVALGAASFPEGGSSRKGTRPVYFPERGGFVECPVYDRYRIGADAGMTGPAVIEERETTVILLPGDRAAVDRHGNLIIDVGQEG